MDHEQAPSAGQGWEEPRPTALLILADGTVIEGVGFGAIGQATGEVCFNTAITGYQEILTDPSYTRQIVTFTFPHIGNVGANDDDIEMVDLSARTGPCGVVLAVPVTDPSNWRAAHHLDAWLKKRGIVGIAGVDTRALTVLVRENGMPNAVIAHDPAGNFDRAAMKAQLGAFHGMVGTDLVPEVTTGERYVWQEAGWTWPSGYRQGRGNARRVVAVDYGLKRNILRMLSDQGCDVTVVPATASAADILALAPDGVFLSNGPGDPAATGAYAVPVIREILDRGVPIFGICLGHQLLGLALGATTVKMHQGHHGANHPVKDLTTGKVEITSMNHGFAIDRATLPANAEETHVSLFDGSNCGIRLKDRPAFSVQYHPEASPGPQDSHYLFKRFADLIDTTERATAAR